jgi:hypothetical protein
MPASIGEFIKQAIDWIFDQQLAFAVIHGHAPKGVHARGIAVRAGGGIGPQRLRTLCTGAYAKSDNSNASDIENFAGIPA